MPHATGEEQEFSGSEDEASMGEVEVLASWEDFVNAAGRNASELNGPYDRLRSAMMGYRNNGARFWMTPDAFGEHVKAAQCRRELPEGLLPLPVSAQPDRLVGGVVITTEGRDGATLVERASQSLPRNGGFASYPSPARTVAQAARETRVQAAGRRHGSDRTDTADQRSQPAREHRYRQRSQGASSSDRSASPRPR